MVNVWKSEKKVFLIKNSIFNKIFVKFVKQKKNDDIMKSLMKYKIIMNNRIVQKNEHFW